MNDGSSCCPKCNWPLDGAGACFCPNCGGDLASAPASPAEDKAGGTLRAPPDAARRSASTGGGLDYRGNDTHGSVISGDLDGLDLEILYNVSRLFVEGLEMPFQFRITPLRGDVADLCIEIRRRQTVPRGEILVARDEPAWICVQGKTMDNPVGFRPEPGSAGHVTFDIYIGYQSAGVRKWFTARKTHTIFQPKAQADSVVRELNIQFHNELSQGHAGDAQVHQTLHGIENLIHAKKDYVEDFRGVDVPELWVRLPLARCQYKPMTGERTGMGQPPAAAVQSRISLRGDSGTVHLLSGSRLTLGRNRENDLMTRVTLADGTAPAKPNERISRYHGQIQLHDNRCTLVDKGWDPVAKVSKPSAMGLMLDNQVVPRGQSVNLPLDRAFTITLAPAGQQQDDVYVLNGRVWTCGAIGGGAGCRKLYPAHEPAGLVLQARDKPQEAYVLLWAYLPLSRIFSHWGEGCICRAGDAFMLGADGRCEWLIPGHTVPVAPGKSMKIMNYRE
ncbi:MAG: FHA domain-containing protein [bacterium]